MTRPRDTRSVSADLALPLTALGLVAAAIVVIEAAAMLTGTGNSASVWCATARPLERRRRTSIDAGASGRSTRCSAARPAA